MSIFLYTWERLQINPDFEWKNREIEKEEEGCFIAFSFTGIFEFYKRVLLQKKKVVYIYIKLSISQKDKNSLLFYTSSNILSSPSS